MAKNYRPIPIPEGIQVSIEPDRVVVKGKMGSLLVRVRHGMTVKSDSKEAVVEGGPGVDRAHVGTLRAHLRNAFAGVAKGFEKVLQVRGMGYKVQKTKEGVRIQCGFSHPVGFAVPEGITFEVNQVPNPDDTKQQMFEIAVRGMDCQAVGQAAARIRSAKPADTYKGKGIRYRGEFVRKKAGKRAAGTEA